MTGPTWTHFGEQLPWLRGQAVHLAGQGSAPLVADRLAEAGFRIATTPPASGGDARYAPVTEALRLPASTADNLDALADAIRELPDRWPSTPRLALLMPGAQHLIERDLLAWFELAMLLRQASTELWDAHQVVFGTVFFVPDGSFGADLPR